MCTSGLAFCHIARVRGGLEKTLWTAGEREKERRVTSETWSRYHVKSKEVHEGSQRCCANEEARSKEQEAVIAKDIEK